MDNNIIIDARQQLIMSQAMEKAFSVLTLPTLELHAYIRSEAEPNPLITFDCPLPFLPLYEELIASPVPSHVFLLPPNQIRIAEYLIHDIDTQGVLVEPIEDIARTLGVERSLIQQVIEHLREAISPSICAQSTKEALLLRLLAMKADASDIEIIELHYEDLIHKRYHQIIKKRGTSYARIQKLLALLLTQTHSTQEEYVVPDLILDEDGVRLHLSPSLSFEQQYLKYHSDPALRKHVAAAKWLMRVLKRREKMLLTIGNEIAEAYHNDLYKTLSTKEMCELLSCHESTLARTLSSKYIQTPSGTYTLRSFFSQRRTLKLEAALDELIRLETTPHTDEELAALLTKKGIPCARRTVNKYRKKLGIPKASLRKYR